MVSMSICNVLTIKVAIVPIAVMILFKKQITITAVEVVGFYRHVRTCVCACAGVLYRICASILILVKLKLHDQ